MSDSMSDYHQRIQQQYANSGEDATALFQEIMHIGADIGLTAALAILAECVTERRQAWIIQHRQAAASDDPVTAGYHWFYQQYLGISAPDDGEIVEHTPQRMVTRWWNPCPTLEACQRLGLDTRVVCHHAYQQPVEAFLKQIDPRLRFARNYDCIRPHAAFCEEIIFLED